MDVTVKFFMEDYPTSRHWNCFLFSVATDGHGLKLEKDGPTIFKFYAVPAKSTPKKSLWLVLLDEIVGYLLHNSTRSFLFWYGKGTN